MLLAELQYPSCHSSRSASQRVSSLASPTLADSSGTPRAARCSNGSDCTRKRTNKKIARKRANPRGVFFAAAVALLSRSERRRVQARNRRIRLARAAAGSADLGQTLSPCHGQIRLPRSAGPQPRGECAGGAGVAARTLSREHS
jgi:hypothetical protein